MEFMGILSKLILILFFSTNTKASFIVNELLKFPHLMEKPFSIEIKQKFDSETTNANITGAFITRIVDSEENEKEISLYDCSSEDTLNFYGTVMDIIVWKIYMNYTKVMISIMFKKKAHKDFLEIYYSSVTTESEQNEILSNLYLADRIYRNSIDLYLPSKFNFTIVPLDASRNEILLGDTAVASCRIYDGIPLRKPIFSIHESLNVTGGIYIKSKNEIKLFFRSTLANHLTNLSCSAGGITESLSIFIKHHPTSIFLEPNINETLESNSSIKCYTKNGYPAPYIYWEFIKGPENAPLYYNLFQNTSELYFKANCPIKSFWIFNCHVKSSEKLIKRTVKFSISKHPSKLYVVPEINKRVQSNSTISCIIKDGYPNPDIKWKLIKGPPNAYWYYDVLSNGSKIFLNTNNYPGTIWQFKCIVKSILTRTTKIINKTISFTIAKNVMENCDIKCVNTRISEMEESIEDNNKLHDDIKQIKIFIIKISTDFERFSRNIEKWKINIKSDFVNLNESLKQNQSKIVQKFKANIKLLNETIQTLKDDTISKFSNLNKSLKVEIENRKIETMKIAKFSFYHIFQSVSYVSKSSPKFEWVNNTFVQLWIDVMEESYETLRIRIRISSYSLKPMNMDIISICRLTRYSKSNKYIIATKQIFYQGSNIVTEISRTKFNEVFDSVADTKCIIKCSLF